MPAIDDFPPVGQREYRAKAGQPGEASPPRPAEAGPPRVYEDRGSAGGQGEPKRKLGLLERLSWRSRGEGESVAPQPGSASYPQANSATRQRAVHAATSGSGEGARRGSGRTSVDSEQEAELPVFFGNERK